MPDPSARKATPPPPPNRKAPRDILQPPAEEAPKAVEPDEASLEPTDDLSDYLVSPDPEPELSADSNLEANKIEASSLFEGALVAGSVGVIPPVTTADTELVLRLQAELAAAEARLAGRQSDVRSYPTGSAPETPKNGETVVIHVREDGFTANGRVWYVGQELEFTVGAPNWDATVDRKGNSWVLLDDAGQIRQYGRVMFGHGPWPGLAYADEKAAAAELRRGRSAPAITQLSSLNTPKG